MIPKDATTTELTRDVAIIGAGPSGLTAAYRLQQAGHTVAVIEARERVGGRTWSNHINGAFLEIGGQWVSPDQTALISLISVMAKTSTATPTAPCTATRETCSPPMKKPNRKWCASLKN